MRGHFECGIEGEDEYGEGEGEKRRGGKVRKLKENRSCVSQTPIKEPWNTFPAKVVVVSDQLENANGEKLRAPSPRFKLAACEIGV